MRTVGAGNNAQPTSTRTDLTDAVQIKVANSSDVLVDLTTYAVSLEYNKSADEIVDAATVVFRRLEGASSLAPLMTASPPVDLGRRIVVLINAGSGTYKEVFRGKITDVDWPERFGDVTVQCLDQAGVAARTWIETERSYGSTAGVSLETVMQSVATDNMTAPVPTLYFPAATSAVVQHVAGDPPYGPTDQSVLDAERSLAESIGWTIRYRNFDATADDWKWTVFQPSRTKTTPDHTFATSDYWDVTQMKLSDADIRNVIEVEYIGEGGAKESVTVSDATSIATYGRLYAKISEGSDSPVNNSTLATALGNAALSDLKDPDALLEIACRYFWPGEIGVDLYRFTANQIHFSSDQDLAAMSFRHRIAVNERPTTWITVRGKPSAGVLSWRRRTNSAAVSAIADVPKLQITGFRETARTATTITNGWKVSGSVQEQWLFLKTVAQPVSGDPFSTLTGVPTYRLTATTTSYTVDIPATGYVTYGRLVPISADAVRGTFWDFTVQPNTPSQLLQRARALTTSATQVVVRVAVADPHPSDAVDVSVAYTATGCTVAEASPQTILAASITADIDTTGTKDFTVTRPAFGSGTGRVAFTASASGRLSDVDAVEVPAVDRDFTTAQISTAEIAALAVTAAKIGAAAVEEAKVATGAITEAKLGAAAVTTAKLANLAVTDAILAASAVTTTKISDTAVTSAKIAANTIVAGNIAAGTITTTEIAANTITAGDIAAGTITATELASDSVTAVKILAGSVTTAKIAAGAVTANEIAANTITAAKIAALTITAAELAAGSVTAEKISVTNLAAINADLGTITAGHLRNAGDTAAIRLSGATALPSTNYLDFTATGTSPFLKHPGATLLADGTATFKAVKITGDGPAPSVAIGEAADRYGTGYAVSVAGKDTAGTITLTTGTGPTGAVGRPNSMVVLTFGTAYATAPYAIVVPVTADGAEDAQEPYYAETTTTTMTIKGTAAGASGYSASLTFKWAYMVIA